MKRFKDLAARCAITLALLITAADIAFAQTATAYAELTTTQSYTEFVGPIPIDGLVFGLPAASSSYNVAIVTLSMPNLVLSAPTSKTALMSALLEIVAPFSPKGVLIAGGSIGCDTPGVSVSGSKPITIVLRVPLGTTAQGVEAEWDSTNGTVTTQNFASLSAVLSKE